MRTFSFIASGILSVAVMVGIMDLLYGFPPDWTVIWVELGFAFTFFCIGKLLRKIENLEETIKKNAK